MGIPISRNPDTPEGLEQRPSVGILWIPTELSHSSKLELRNPVGPRRIPVEFQRLSYKDGSRLAGRPTNPQSLATLLTSLGLATTLRELCKWNLQNVVCVCRLSPVGGICRAMGNLHRLGQGNNSPCDGRPMSLASTNFLHHHTLSLLMETHVQDVLV
jgi:hypothetical protein